jgi:carbonic anhydrase
MANKTIFIIIGGVGYAGEIHLVHMNTKYTTMEDAMKHGDGLAVLAVFLNVIKRKLINVNK